MKNSGRSLASPDNSAQTKTEEANCFVGTTMLEYLSVLQTEMSRIKCLPRVVGTDTDR